MSAALGTGAVNGLGFGSYDGLKPLEIEGIKNAIGRYGDWAWLLSSPIVSGNFAYSGSLGQSAANEL
jgi:hypothetical protein